jgi:hypothetical protein
VTPSRREALARKYATMLALREAHDRGEGVASNTTLRALAEEFPGALHEIDRLPMDLLRARTDATARACHDPAAVAPWMSRVIAWHALLAATLRAKRDARLAVDEPASLAARLTAESGVVVDDAFARSLASPARGRVVPLVMGAVAAHFDEDVAAVRATLFPWRD